MAKIIPATRKRNVLWPVRRTGKGLATGTMALRYEAALRNLLRVPKGSLIFAPGFGTRVHLLRTQSITPEDLAFFTQDLQSDIAEWIPDIDIITVDFEQNPDDEELKVLVVWGIPDATSAATPQEPRFVFGPFNTTVTI